MPLDPATLRNRLLQSLPASVLELLLPLMRRVDLPFGEIVMRPDVPIDNVYFPESGWISLVVSLEGGDATEVGMVGQEGMVGVPLVFGVDRSVQEAMVQSAGQGLVMEAGAFRRAVGDNTALRDLLLRYAFAFNTQLTMTAACNCRHQLNERMARWLLMAHDRTEGDEFLMTHEFLSMMLGVRRSGVTTAAAALREAGLIRYERGRIRITDRPGLVAAACECHQVVTREFRRVLGEAMA